VNAGMPDHTIYLIGTFSLPRRFSASLSEGHTEGERKRDRTGSKENRLHFLFPVEEEEEGAAEQPLTRS
jgi:hypothetical protein